MGWVVGGRSEVAVGMTDDEVKRRNGGRQRLDGLGIVWFCFGLALVTVRTVRAPVQ